MGTVMIYNSVASKEVKPDIVGLGITLNSKADTAKEAIKKINENRNIAKTFITSKASYRPDSYHQMNVDLKKRTVREYYYIHKETGKEISQKEFDKLNQIKRNDYDSRTRERFLYYEAILDLIAVLNYGDTVITDFMDIFNMCAEKEFKCEYQHTISDELEKATKQELYTECINQGVKAVKTIVNGLDFVENHTVTLLEVRDPAAVSTPARYGAAKMSKNLCMEEMCFDGAAAYEPEEIIMPELLEELFNNNIELKKSLDLTLEF